MLSVLAQGVAGTREVVSRFGGRVEYVYQENRRPAAAKNRGIGLARREFVSFLDSDDVWLPARCASNVSYS